MHLSQRTNTRPRLLAAGVVGLLMGAALVSVAHHGAGEPNPLGLPVFRAGEPISAARMNEAFHTLSTQVAALQQEVALARQPRFAPLGPLRVPEDFANVRDALASLEGHSIRPDEFLPIQV